MGTKPHRVGGELGGGPGPGRAAPTPDADPLLEAGLRALPEAGASVFNQPECIRAVATNYVALKVNVADDPALARDYGVERWPTDVILAATGQELYRGISPAEMNRYISQLDQTAAFARLGMPNGGSPTTDFSAANTAASRDRASAFPNGTPAGSAYLPPAGDQASGGYQPGSYNNPSAQTAQSIYNPTMGPRSPIRQ